MEDELEQFHKESIELKMNIKQLQHKQKATAREVHREMEKVWGTPTMHVPQNDIGGDRTLVKHSSEQTVTSRVLCPRTKRASG